ncbi:MAG: PKD domain-containing protein [Betaproteobacteria bacterium]|nr:MAG: PKD domain-containing protein [Betaproteobacteria bacterium]
MIRLSAYEISKKPSAPLRLLTFIALLALMAVQAFAGTVTLAWDPVISPSLAGYKLYFGPAPGNYTASVDVGNVSLYTLFNLAEGATYHFAASAYDSGHIESGFSNDASATIPYAAPVAQFSASTTSGTAPLALNFTSTSTGTVTSYAWSFGDGGTSGAQNPSYVYLTAGVYTVSLTVTGPGGSNTQTRTNYIAVSSPGLGATTTLLSSNSNPSQLGMPVTFTATVVGTAPSGGVYFADGGNLVSDCAASPLVGSYDARTAICVTSALSVGTHSIVATYAGDTLNASSSSAALFQGVMTSSASSLVNPSFEVPALGSTYQYSPNVPGIGWTFGVGTGIEGNGSAWLAATAPDGTQAAFIQGTGLMMQTVNLNAGSYMLSFEAAQRPCCSSSYLQPIRVTVDGADVGARVRPPSTDFTGFSVSFEILTSGPHTIGFTGTEPNDKSTFIDAVTLVGISVPTNGSFEVPALGSGYQYSPSGAGVGWTFGAGTGIEGNGSQWFAAAAPDGSQAAFIQSLGTMAQTVDLASGSYTLSFKAAQRACCITPYLQPVMVTVDGVQVGDVVFPPSTDFTAFSIPFQILTSGPHTIAFTGTDASDKSTFIDAVNIR